MKTILHMKRYEVNKEPEKYCHSKILLYYPWNNEDEIISGFSSYQDPYINKQNIIHANAKKTSMKIAKYLTLLLKNWRIITSHNLHGSWWFHV